MKKYLTARNVLPVAAVILFFSIFLLLGLSIYRAYGTYVDEPAQMTVAHHNYEYLKRGDPAQLVYHDWDYGPVFELFTMTTIRFLPLNWPPEAEYYLRHLDVFLVFWLGCMGFFGIVARRFKSWALGLLGTAFLILSPVIFGNAFYNSKDIPFLSFYILCLFTMILFLERPNLLTAMLHALVSALLIDIRIPGLVLVAITLGMLALQLLARTPGGGELHPRAGKAILAGGVYALLSGGLVVAFFPVTWSDPLGKLVQVFGILAHRSWLCCCNLLLGQCYPSGQSPWYYIPAWLGVTTPEFYLFLFVIGLAAVLAFLFLRPNLDLTSEKRHAIIYLGALFLPLGVVIAANSVLYNAWRQMYFIYAPFLLIGMEGFVAAGRFLRARLGPRIAVAILGTITAASLVSTASFMLINHPYQYLYFNSLAGRDMQQVKARFEMDYWGVTLLDGLRYVLAHDPRNDIVIASRQIHIQDYSKMLTQAEQERLRFTQDPAFADYYLSEYYMHPQEYSDLNEVYSIQIGNAKVMSVFKLK